MPGTRACSPAEQLNSRLAALDGEPAGDEGVQAARRGRRRRCRGPCRMTVCGLLSCNGGGWQILMVADVRGPGLLAGRRPRRMSRGTLGAVGGEYAGKVARQMHLRRS